MGVGVAAGRAIKLGEGERGAQLKAARGLLPRDGDGGQEGFLRGRGVRGVALEQDFAARPMQLCFERAISGAVARRQRFVEDGDRAVGIACRASASASAIFKSPSKFRASRSRSSSAPRRMSSSPWAGAPLCDAAQPSRNTLNA